MEMGQWASTLNPKQKQLMELITESTIYYIIYDGGCAIVAFPIVLCKPDLLTSPKSKCIELKYSIWEDKGALKVKTLTT